MDKSFNKDFYGFMAERQEKALTPLLKDPNYLKLRDQFCTLIHSVDKDLMMEIESLASYMEAIKQDHVYKQGFTDALRLVQMQNDPIDYTELGVKSNE